MQHTIMFSHLQKEGIYDNSHRARFTNIDNEEYVGMWDSKVYVRIPAGDSVTLPEAQAITFGIDLATRVMMKDERKKFIPTMLEPAWEMSQRTNVGIPAKRDPFEKQIVQWLDPGEETPEMQALRSQVREQVLNDMKAEVSTDAPKGPVSKDQLSIVGDRSNPARAGHEFEGLAALK